MTREFVSVRSMPEVRAVRLAIDGRAALLCRVDASYSQSHSKARGLWYLSMSRFEARHKPKRESIAGQAAPDAAQQRRANHAHSASARVFAEQGINIVLSSAAEQGNR